MPDYNLSDEFERDYEQDMLRSKYLQVQPGPRKEYRVSIAVDEIGLAGIGGNLLAAAKEQVARALEEKMSAMGYPPGSYIMQVDRIEQDNISRLIRIYARAVVTGIRPVDNLIMSVVPPLQSLSTTEKPVNKMEEIIKVPRNIKISLNITTMGGEQV
jgi:hypothetical protein